MFRRVMLLMAMVGFAAVITPWSTASQAEESYAHYGLVDPLPTLFSQLGATESVLQVVFGEEYVPNWQLVKNPIDVPFPLNFAVSSTRGIMVTQNVFGSVIIALNPKSTAHAVAAYEDDEGSIAVYIGQGIQPLDVGQFSALIDGELVTLSAAYVAEYHDLDAIAILPFEYFD